MSKHHDLPELFSRAEQAFRRVAYDRGSRSAACVVTPSRYSRNRIVELLGVDPERVIAIYPGVDHARFCPDAASDDALLAGLDLPDRFVIYPANAWPHKNHDRLIAALAALQDRTLGLVLTGQTYGRASELAELARRAGVAERVRHLRFVSSDVLPALYRRAAAMVFPSLYEGFGAPPLEAMACGCPVAASARASLSEICADAALPLDPEETESIAEAIERIASDEALRTQLREAGLARAREFTWRRAAREHTLVYERAIKTFPGDAET